MSRSILTLLRHAKSSWNNHQQSDHDRPLNERGNRDAPDMARRLVDRDSIPALILCSTAQRTRDTAKHLLSVFGEPSPAITFDDALYLGSPDKLLEALENVPDNIQHVMIIAHNPGIEDLSAILQSCASDTMPTAAIRQFSCPSFSGLKKQLALSVIRPLQADKTNSIDLIYSDHPKSAIA